MLLIEYIREFIVSKGKEMTEAIFFDQYERICLAIGEIISPKVKKGDNNNSLCNAVPFWSSQKKKGVIDNTEKTAINNAINLKPVSIERPIKKDKGKHGTSKVVKFPGLQSNPSVSATSDSFLEKEARTEWRKHYLQLEPDESHLTFWYDRLCSFILRSSFSLSSYHILLYCLVLLNKQWLFSS